MGENVRWRRFSTRKEGEEAGEARFLPVLPVPLLHLLHHPPPGGPPLPPMPKPQSLIMNSMVLLKVCTRYRQKGKGEKKKYVEAWKGGREGGKGPSPPPERWRMEKAKRDGEKRDSEKDRGERRRERRLNACLPPPAFPLPLSPRPAALLFYQCHVAAAAIGWK